jgi:uncharacterized SAM-binding protein YcdF (DUF218 family)
MRMDLLISPLTLALLCGALAFWAAGRRRWLARLSAGLLLMALALMTPAGANGLLWLVETPPAVAANCLADQDRHHVLLAGGFHRRALDEQDVAALTQASVSRAAFFARRFGAGDARPVLVAGGGPDVAESAVMATLLMHQGVAPERVDTERGSRTTWASAQALAADQGTRGTRIVLSTSALHLRRAALAFEAFGFDVCAHPLHSDVIVPDHVAAFWPQAPAAVKGAAVLHELVGLLAYRWRAWQMGR